MEFVSEGDERWVWHPHISAAAVSNPIRRIIFCTFGSIKIRNTLSDPAVLLYYFPQLTPRQQQQFRDLFPLYADWNAKINVISRKDMDQFYVNHVLHSLGIARVVTFLPGATVLDVGTGGGFPGIPLAILFPDTKFHLVDSIGKKIKVVQEVAGSIGLTNVTAQQERAENLRGQYDFVVSRAVTRMKEFYGWVNGRVKKDSRHELFNGILYLKGGDLTDEMAELRKPYSEYLLANYFKEPFFETKKVIYVPL
jgi:16S rRNA (guanine527-N7)-methyltransferase